MTTFKTLEELEEYNKKQIGLLNANLLKDNTEKKYEEDYFKRITQNSQPHKVFNSDWRNYYTLEIGDTLLPYADSYKIKGTLQVENFEVIVFAEVDKDNNIDMYLRFGEDFRIFLNNYYTNKKVATTISSVENKIYKTIIVDFKAKFSEGMLHFTQMKFVLDLLDIKHDVLVVEHYFVNSWWTDKNDMHYLAEFLSVDTTYCCSY